MGKQKPEIRGNFARAAMMDRWKQWACTIKRDAHVLYLAARDPRMPWYAKALAITVAAYAASPIDLMPDFVPVNHFPLVGGSI
jgi:uncharacterized membrane protein YkvA (DUF1232 family)